jgi:hypothetical protein
VVRPRSGCEFFLVSSQTSNHAVRAIANESTEEERIPYREGFTKSHHGLSDVVNMLQAVEAVPV